MKRIIFICLFSIISIMAHPQRDILLTVGDKTISATLADNSATRELIELLQKEPIVVKMNDYGGFEKVGSLPQSFTTSNSRITTEPGDIMLYQGNNLVIFYGVNSWSYTRLGKVDNIFIENLKDFLGTGEIELTLSLDIETGVENPISGGDGQKPVYDIHGNRISNGITSPGLYIVDGKKMMVKAG